MLLIFRADEAGREALTDMPPRSEQELDPVTLHNQALLNMDEDPTGGFEKLNFLMGNIPCPDETFGNLCLLYAKYQYLDAAADLLAEGGGVGLDPVRCITFPANRTYDCRIVSV